MGFVFCAYTNKNCFFLEHKLNGIAYYVCHGLMLCPYSNAQQVLIVCVSRKNP